MSEYVDTLNWLLDSEPFVKYNTIVNLIGKPDTSSDAKEYKKQMMCTKPVSAILKGQNPDGGFYDLAAAKKWCDSAVRAGYFPKYTGSAWKAIFLAQLGADQNDTRVKALGEYLLRNSFNETLGSFNVHLELRRDYVEDVIMPCFIGNMIHTTCRLGFSDRDEVKESFKNLIKWQRYDDGDHKAPNSFPYRGKKERCWGAHTCYWGVTKLLRAMTVVPQGYWNNEAEEAKKRAVDFVLLHRLIWSSHNPDRLITQKNTRPDRLTAPLTYYDDIIEIISNLLSLGVKHHSVDEAIEFVLSKKNENGRWIADNTPGPLDAPFAKKGHESKWITFRILKMLKLAGFLHI